MKKKKSTYLIRYKGNYYPSIIQAAVAAGVSAPRLGKTIRDKCKELKTNHFTLEYKEETFFINRYDQFLYV